MVCKIGGWTMFGGRLKAFAIHDNGFGWAVTMEDGVWATDILMALVQAEE